MNQTRPAYNSKNKYLALSAFSLLVLMTGTLLWLMTKPTSEINASGITSFLYTLLITTDWIIGTILIVTLYKNLPPSWLEKRRSKILIITGLSIWLLFFLKIFLALIIFLLLAITGNGVSV